MNPNLNALRISLLQCLSSPDVTAEEVTEVIRETARTEMDAGTEKTNKCRTILEKLRIPYHYTTCPDYLSNPVGAGKSESVTINFDGIIGAEGADTISFG